MPDKKERVKLLTPIGRLSFPSIFSKAEPMEGSTSAAKYEATIIFDVDYLKKNPAELARYNAIKAAVDKACLEKFKKSIKEAKQKIDRFWDPLRDGASKDHLNGFGEGTIFFKASGNRRPGVVGSDGKTLIEDPEALYAGCRVRFSVSPYAFDNKMKGVGIGLNSVMFVGDGERLDGGSDPAEDFGEFASEGGGEDSADMSDLL